MASILLPLIMLGIPLCILIYYRHASKKRHEQIDALQQTAEYKLMEADYNAAVEYTIYDSSFLIGKRWFFRTLSDPIPYNEIVALNQTRNGKFHYLHAVCGGSTPTMKIVCSFRRELSAESIKKIQADLLTHSGQSFIITNDENLTQSKLDRYLQKHFPNGR